MPCPMQGQTRAQASSFVWLQICAVNPHMLRHILRQRNSEVLGRACVQLHTARAAQVADPAPSAQAHSSAEQPWRQQVPPAAPAAQPPAQQTALAVQPRPQPLLERALSAVNTALNAVHRQPGLAGGLGVHVAVAW